MTANTAFPISIKSQEGVIQFLRQTSGMINQQWNIREQMRKVDLEYSRELDLTTQNQRGKLANSYGDSDKLQNITIPVVMPAVEAAVVYQSSVFLSGTPIFDVVGSPTNQDAAVQMAAIIDSNAIRGGWVRELQLFFRDGFKYNLSALEVVWDKKVTFSLETDAAFGKNGKPRQVVWEGNCLNRWDPYNTFWDTRLPITEVATYGEFAGRVQLMSRIALKKYVAELGDNVIIPNLMRAFSSQFGVGAGTASATGSYYVPPINSRALTQISPLLGTDWMSWAQASGALGSNKITIDYKNLFEVTTLYARILPSDFAIKVPAENTPQVWKFIIINQQVVIYAERQTNAHERIPVLFGQPLEDGLSYQTKSLAENVSSIQSVTSAMMNSVIAARRRAVSDRGIYDPSRISEANINSTNPSAKIPVKPAAYGKPLSEAYHQIPFEDRNSAQIMQELGPIIKLSDVITGQNPARQGQFVKGNKTKTEFSDVMEHSNGRDQNTSLLYEAQVFTPLKEMLKLNILQYQGPESIYYRQSQQEIKIDPVVLRKAVMEFKVSDGLTPTSKLIGADTLQVALQVIGSSPQIASEYNVGPMFSYLMKTQSAIISEFEKSKEQVAYEQATRQWQQMYQMALDAKQPFQQPQPLPEQFGYLVNGQLSQTKPPVTDAIGTFMKTLETAQNGNPSPQ